MNSLQVIPEGDANLPMNEQQIQDQVNLIQRVMKKVMKEDVHYGTIPGCGDKPALLKPGAEKICLTFRLAARFQIEHTDLIGGHREYTVRCTLVAPNGAEVGEGIGVCSTMENKYRYRWDNTGQTVPPEYWETRDPDLLGGPQFAARKVGGTWTIFQKIDHDNPADYYNTAAKMAKKRAHVDATLTTTAASDIFEQDIDEMVENGVMPEGQGEAPGKPKVAQPQRKSGNVMSGVVTEGQRKLLFARCKASGVDVATLCKEYDAADLDSFPKAKVNDALDWLQQQGSTE